MRGLSARLNEAAKFAAVTGAPFENLKPALDRERVRLPVARDLREARGLRDHAAARGAFLVREAEQLQVGRVQDLPRLLEVRERGIDVVPVGAEVDAERAAARLGAGDAAAARRSRRSLPRRAGRPRSPQARARARNVPSCHSFRVAGAARWAERSARMRMRCAGSRVWGGPRGGSPALCQAGGPRECLSESYDGRCDWMLVSTELELSHTISDARLATTRRRPRFVRLGPLTQLHRALTRRTRTGSARRPRGRRPARPATGSSTGAARAAGT